MAGSGGVTVSLPETARRLLNPPVFAVLATVNADGSPQSSVVWLRTDGDELVFSTIRGRLKTGNMERDPQVSVCAYDPDDPYHYVEVRGTVSLTEKGGDDLIDEMSRAYDGKPWKHRPDETRVVVRVTPARVVEHV
jgi:PPOX class probable F420-dependent enzyme